MHKLEKKILSLLVALVMVFQLFPMMSVKALAEGDDGKGTVVAADMRLEEAYANGLVSDYISGPEKTEYTAEDVLAEMPDLREEDVKHFLLTNGNSLAISYGYPVHYKDESGAYQDIDNRLALYNADGTLSEEEPDAVLNAWLEEQKELLEKENEEAAEEEPSEPSQEDEVPNEEAPGEIPADGPTDEPPSDDTSPEAEAPSEEGAVQDEGTEPGSEPDPDPQQDEEGQGEAGEGEPGSEGEISEVDDDPEVPDDPDVEGTEPEQGTIEEPSPADAPEERPIEETPPAEQEPESSGLGDVPDDLPTKVPGPDDPRYYHNEHGLASVRFAVLSNAERLVTFSYGKYSVSLTPQVLIPAPKSGEIVGPAVGRIDPVDTRGLDSTSLEAPSSRKTSLLP